MLIRDHTVIVYDNAIRSTKIARALNFMNRLSELPVRDAELIADVFSRIPTLVPNDASHERAYSSRVDQSLGDWGSPSRTQSTQKTVKGSPCRRLGRKEAALQFKMRHCGLASGFSREGAVVAGTGKR